MLPNFLISFTTISINVDWRLPFKYLHRSIVTLFNPRNVRYLCSFGFLYRTDTFIFTHLKKCKIHKVISYYFNKSDHASSNAHLTKRLWMDLLYASIEIVRILPLVRLMLHVRLYNTSGLKIHAMFSPTIS